MFSILEPNTELSAITNQHSTGNLRDSTELLKCTYLKM